MQVLRIHRRLVDTPSEEDRPCAFEEEDCDDSLPKHLLKLWKSPLERLWVVEDATCPHLLRDDSRHMVEEHHRLLEEADEVADDDDDAACTHGDNDLLLLPPAMK